MAKIRKRLWLGDVYKALIEGDIPEVQGVEWLHINKYAIRVVINGSLHEFSAIDKEYRRKAVKAINKIISEVNKNVPQ